VATLDIITFDYNSRRYRLAALAVVGFGSMLALFFGVGSWKAGAGIAAFFFIIAAIIFAQSFRRGPILVIGPEGLTYAPFSPRPVPWSDIAAVTLVGYEGRAVKFPGKASYFRQPNMDTVNFAVSEPKRYPSGPGRAFSRLWARMNGLPPISIQPYYIKGATMEAIADGIRRHWTGRIENKLFNYPRKGNPY
jgi:hypothetical protein